MEELADSTGLMHGSVSIGASETALNIYLLDRLKNFHMEYPGIRIKIYNHSTPEAIRAVKSGKIDFAVVTTPAEAEAPLKQIMLQPFQEILVGGKTFTALGSQQLSLAELEKYPLIWKEEPCDCNDARCVTACLFRALAHTNLIRE